MTPTQKKALLAHSRKCVEILEKANYSTNADDYTVDDFMVLTDFEGFGGTGGSKDEGDILSEFYTPHIIVSIMWRLCCKFGFKGGNVLEPSCGTGRFISNISRPTNCQIVGIEMNKESATIAKIINPDADIKQMQFEEIFVKQYSSLKNKKEQFGLPAESFDLIIGNPPYGAFSGKYAGVGEKDYTEAANYVEYFILRGLDMLKSGGLLCYIVGGSKTTFLGNNHTKGKDKIDLAADLLLAYQFPVGAFFNTDALTQIVLFRKK